MFEKTVISHPEVYQPSSPYSLGIKVRGEKGVIYLSGQVALDGNGEIVGKGNVEAQSRQVFHNLNDLLSSEGASFSNVVKLTSFLTEVDHIPVFTSVRKEFLKESDGYPANTLVIVKALANPDWLVEVEGIAVI